MTAKDLQTQTNKQKTKQPTPAPAKPTPALKPGSRQPPARGNPPKSTQRSSSGSSSSSGSTSPGPSQRPTTCPTGDAAKTTSHAARARPPPPAGSDSGPARQQPQLSDSAANQEEDARDAAADPGNLPDHHAGLYQTADVGEPSRRDTMMPPATSGRCHNLADPGDMPSTVARQGDGNDLSRDDSDPSLRHLTIPLHGSSVSARAARQKMLCISSDSAFSKRIPNTSLVSSSMQQPHLITSVGRPSLQNLPADVATQT